MNATHTAIDGFEGGRIYNGHRFVSPIAGNDQIHLGSVEIVFGPDNMASAMMKQYSVLSDFYVS